MVIWCHIMTNEDDDILKQIRAFDKWDKILCGGIRVKTFRKLIHLARHLNDSRYRKSFAELKIDNKD